MLEHTTVFALQGSLLLALSGVILFAFRDRRREREDQSHRWLAAAFFLYGMGLEVLAMEHALAGPAITLAGNALLLAFCALTARGLALATGQRSRAPWLLLTLVPVTVVDFAYFTYLQPNTLLLSWQSGVLTAGTYGWLIVLLLQADDEAIQPAVRAMVGLLALHIVVSIVRLVVWRYTGTKIWFSGMNLISSVGLALCYLWMDMLRVQAGLRLTAITDALTGLYNRRAMETVGTRELQRANRAGAPCSAVMMDVDRFKEINDTLGHAAGDAMLCAVAGILRDVERSGDTAMRMGGDEFFVLLPDANEEVAGAMASRIRRMMLELRLQAGNGQTYTATLSVGHITLCGPDLTTEDLMHASDAVLHAEKREGRTQRTAARPSPIQGNGAGT